MRSFDDLDVGRALTRAGLRGVEAPLAPLADSGHALILCSAVEVWDFQLVVHLIALPTDAGDAAQRSWEEAFEEWGRRRALQPKGARPSEPPAAPGERIADVPVCVTDSEGTRFTRRQSSGGGTGSEWRGAVTLAPGPAPESRRLTLSHPSVAFPSIELSAFPRSG